MTLYERALDSLRLQRGDARRLAADAVAAEPQSAAARLLEATILASSRDVRDFENAGWAYARLLTLEDGSPHLAALAAALDGNLAAAVRIYDAILDAHPEDFVALWAAQLMDYYQGDALAQRERSGRVLARSSPSMPGYHAVLSMHAFALHECGDYAAAEDNARRALELEPRDMRAQHAMLHVFEMRGQPANGVRWAAARSAQWESHHMWWHLALFMLALRRPHGALTIYDLRLQDESVAGMIDASALLWRLHLARVDVGERFAVLAERWAERAEDAFCAFNDLHAMMAFVGAERWDLARVLLRAQQRRLMRLSGANHDMTRLVGYPASRALAAFGRGDYSTAEALLRALPPVAHRVGGSHAQRDVLHLTQAAAAARAPAKGYTHGFALSQRLAAA
ncbi:MAG TPA: tetratricopeptide repeat protein [Burkholderiales bacterium]|jgi:tetratricopeptide (TPR) repeat protein